MDDFGGIFRLRVQSLKATLKGRSYTTTIDRHVIINRSDREVLVLEAEDLYFPLSSDGEKHRVLKDGHAGDFFSSDGTVNRSALWMVCNIGIKKCTSILSLATKNTLMKMSGAGHGQEMLLHGYLKFNFCSSSEETHLAAF